MIFSRLLLAWVLALTALSVSAEPLVAGDVEAGKKKSASCTACHGADGNSNNPQWPKIAGQHGPYLSQALAQYKNGKRKHQIMSGQAAGLSEQDMKDLAAFYANQSMQPAAAATDKLDRGAALYRVGDSEQNIPACAGCHGPAGLGNAAAAYPRISGQHAQYLGTQLKAYRDGERAAYPAAEIMAGVAQNLSDADIQAVAGYIQGLQPRSASAP